MAPRKTRQQSRRQAENARLLEASGSKLPSHVQCEIREESSNDQKDDDEALLPAKLPTVAEEDVPNNMPICNEERSGGEEEEEKEGKQEQEKVKDGMPGENDGEEGQLLLTDYEKQREQRLKENAAKLASLNLPSLASSLKAPVQLQRHRKTGSSEKEVDADYVPSTSSASQDSADADDHESPNSADAEPQLQQDGMEHLDEDQALQQAIALSLGASGGDISNTKDSVSRTRSTRKQAADKKGSARKKRKGMQEQFTVDEVATIFAVIDEQKKGKFSAAELERVVRSHDFTWSKQEIADMIEIFDNNKDGQLDLPEFQSIFGRANILKVI